MSDFLRILAVFLLVVGNAIFVAAEYALVTARRARLDERAENGSRAARTAVRLLDDPVRFISTVQIGITVFAILVGAIGEPLISRYLDPYLPRGVSFTLSFLVLTYLTLVIGELVPKAVSLQKAEPMAVALALPLDLLGRLLHPVVWVLQGSAHAVTRVFGIRPAPAGIFVHTREDVRRTFEEAEEAGAIEEAEEEMLYKVFDFADKEAHDVMVPRPQVVAVSVDLPTKDALAALIDSPFTRYPVYRGSLDEIAGILHVRDLFSALYDRGIESVSIAELLRPAHFVLETTDLAVLLSDLRRTGQHIAIVVDEYGSVQGIVTLEDVLEEIVGEIEDEYDLPDDSVERLDERRIRVGGTFPIDDFNERFEQALPQEDFHTIAGFVFGQLGRVAEEGDELVWNGLRFRVTDVHGPRIERLDVEFLPREAAEEAGSEA